MGKYYSNTLYVRCSKRDVWVSELFDKMVFNSSLASGQTKTRSIEFLRSCKVLSSFDPKIFKMFWKMPKNYISYLFVVNLETLDLRSDCDVISIWRTFGDFWRLRTPNLEYVRYRGFDSGASNSLVSVFSHFFVFLTMFWQNYLKFNISGNEGKSSIFE